MKQAQFDLPEDKPFKKEVDKLSEVESSFEKVYWFSRVLIDSEHGSKGNDTGTMLKLAQNIDTMLAAESLDIDAAIEVMHKFFLSLHGPKTKIAAKMEDLSLSLGELIDNRQDLKVLKFTIQHVLIPINALLAYVPKSDKEFAEELIRNYLEAKGISGLSDVISMWDRAGRRGSMAQERIVVVAGFRILRKTMEEMLKDREVTHLDSDQALTAYVQEFERRLSRGVRPKRAGRSLEDVTGVILDHFEIENYEDAPAHIKSVFEVDKLINLPDGWHIGISCKRTLRERWKQAASLDIANLNRHKIRSTWHVITHPGDLSESKVIAIGESQGVVYVPDDSHFYKTYGDSLPTRRFLRPLSSFVSDLKQEAKVGSENPHKKQ